MRRKVLTDELATEEKLLAEARAAYGDGAPPPLPEEQTDAEKYREAHRASCGRRCRCTRRTSKRCKKELAALK